MHIKYYTLYLTLKEITRIIFTVYKGGIYMKWTIAQLKKKVHQDNTFSATLDLKEFIPKDEDILDVDTVNVEGTFYIEEDAFYHFDIHIKTTLTVACSRSLKPVALPLDFRVSETFSEDIDDEFRQIDGLTIDLLPIMWSNIYLEKPMRVIHPDAKDMTFEDETKHKEDSPINPKFEKLKDYKS